MPIRAAIPWVAPFVLFMALLAGLKPLGIPQPWNALLWVVVLSFALVACSRSVIELVPKQLLLSTAIGVGVFMLWIAPDALWPGYRSHWLFNNAVVGHPDAGLDAVAQRDTLTLWLRAARAVLLVPILEELFWRGWLARAVDSFDDFRLRPLGSFTTLSFWATALLFASEHGSYWDVGLLCGVIYNLWMAQTRSIADLIWVHAVTNGCLSAYVVFAKQWQYWA
jgi:CAAX prenyl protease-like protein